MSARSRAFSQNQLAELTNMKREFIVSARVFVTFFSLLLFKFIVQKIAALQIIALLLLLLCSL